MIYTNMPLFSRIAQLFTRLESIGNPVHWLLAHQVFRRFVGGFCFSSLVKARIAYSALLFSAMRIVTLQSKVIGYVFPFNNRMPPET